MSIRLTVLTAALAGLALSAATASAVTLGHAGGFKYVRTDTPLPLATFDELKAQCGGTWHAVGGGASASGPTIIGQLESSAPFETGPTATSSPTMGGSAERRTWAACRRS